MLSLVAMLNGVHLQLLQESQLKDNASTPFNLFSSQLIPLHHNPAITNIDKHLELRYHLILHLQLFL